jgi:hypothetical protein
MSKTRITRGFGLLEGFLASKRAQMADRLIPGDLRNGKILDICCMVFECISDSEVETGSLAAATIPQEMLWSLKNQTRRLPDESILLCRVGCPQEND